MSWSIIRCICRNFRGQKSSLRALFCRKTGWEGAAVRQTTLGLALSAFPTSSGHSVFVSRGVLGT